MAVRQVLSIAAIFAERRNPSLKICFFRCALCRSDNKLGGANVLFIAGLFKMYHNCAALVTIWCKI